jgi:hypothetical protein
MYQSQADRQIDSKRTLEVRTLEVRTPVASDVLSESPYLSLPGQRLGVGTVLHYTTLYCSA